MFPNDLSTSSTIKILLGLSHFAASRIQMQISQVMAERDIYRGNIISLFRSEASAVEEEG